MTVQGLETHTASPAPLHLHREEELLASEGLEEASLEIPEETGDETAAKRPTSLKRKFAPIIHASTEYRFLEYAPVADAARTAEPIKTFKAAPATLEIKPIANTPAAEKATTVQNILPSEGQLQQKKPFNPSLEYQLFDEPPAQEPAPIASMEVEMSDAREEESPAQEEVAMPIAEFTADLFEDAPIWNYEAKKNDPFPALEITKCFQFYFHTKEKELNFLINGIDNTNNHIKILSNLTNRLSHAKKDAKKADFSNDPKVKAWIDHIHKKDKTIFASKTGDGPNYALADEAKIDIAITGLDGLLKQLSADLQQQMQTIGSRYEDRSQMTEQMRQILKSANDLMESLARRQIAGR